jgi:peptidoglycan-associated lipoprotein
MKKSLVLFVVLICFLLTGCAKKGTVKEDAAGKKSEQGSTLGTDRTEKEQADARTREMELAKRREEEARKARDKAEFEKGLVAKREPGIEGDILESKALKDIHFDFDKHDIRPSDAEILKANAALLSRYPKVKIQVEGHCDERGTSEYNLALGERRASSAKTYLLTLGIPADRVSTISYGKEKPVDPAHTEQAWEKNRRAHTILLSKP